MRAASTALLMVGFGAGFGVMYKYISPRAAEIAKPLERFVPQSAAAPSTPQVDPAEIRQLDQALKDDPKDFEALRRLGNIRYDQRDFAGAADLYARALEVRPDDVNVRSDRGGALLQSERVDEAIRELQTVLAKEPTHPQAMFILGVALLEGRNDREGALSIWNKLVATHPELPELEAVKRQIKQVEELTRRR